MRKSILLGSTFVATFLLAGLTAHVYGTEIDACYKTKGGKLRLVTESSPVCLPSEIPITWDRQGPPGICEFTRPIINYTLSCQNPFELILSVDIQDDEEIAFYATQKQGGDPPLNMVVFVEPGRNSEHYDLNLGVGPSDESYLLVATDNKGNMPKELFPLTGNVL